MAQLSITEQRKLAYFHALGKVMTESQTQYVFNSAYKSSHNVRSSEIWANEVAYVSSTTMADSEASINPAVTKVTLGELTMIPGSNGEAYYFDSGGTFIRPWISPVDVPNQITNLPSTGYELKLYDSSDSQIGGTTGAWTVDYYAGIIHFGNGYTPSDMGWGTPKATFYYYSGEFGGASGSETISGLTDTIIVTPQSGETLIYSGGTWQNKSFNDLYVSKTEDETVGGDKVFTGNVTVMNNLTVSGTTTTVNSENLNIKDNIITVNSGETGSGVTLGEAGLLIERGLYSDFLVIWDENTETFRAGLSGSTKEVALIEDSKIDGGLVYWDSTSEELKMYDFNLNVSLPKSGQTIIYSGGTWINKDISEITDALYVSKTDTPVEVQFTTVLDYIESGNTYSLGTINWTRNSDENINSQILYATGLTQDSYSIGTGDTSYNFGESVSNDFTIKIVVDDGFGELNESNNDILNVKFANKVYWGTSGTTSITNISGLTYSGWTYVNDEKTRKRTFQLNGNGEYIYYSYPTELGISDQINWPEFKVNGLVNTAWELVTGQTYINQFGHSENYNVYRSTYTQGGYGIIIEKL